MSTPSTGRSLKGIVGTQAQKDRAAQLARSVSGVRAVVNNLEVEGAASDSTSVSASPATSGHMGTRTLAGQVTSVDLTNERLGLRTDAGDLLVHLSSAALSNVRVGDQVNVELGIKSAR